MRSQMENKNFVGRTANELLEKI